MAFPEARGVVLNNTQTVFYLVELLRDECAAIRDAADAALDVVVDEGGEQWAVKVGARASRRTTGSGSRRAPRLCEQSDERRATRRAARERGNRRRRRVRRARRFRRFSGVRRPGAVLRRGGRGRHVRILAPVLEDERRLFHHSHFFSSLGKTAEKSRLKKTSFLRPRSRRRRTRRASFSWLVRAHHSAPHVPARSGSFAAHTSARAAQPRRLHGRPCAPLPPPREVTRNGPRI